MIDLTPSAERMTALLGAITDDQLDRPTPCPDACLGDLIDHVGTLTIAFAGKAGDNSSPSGPPPKPDAANLETGWRERIARDLGSLATAWQDPSAWDGMTTAGGIELPAEVAGLIALDELVVHGWDIAVATGRPYQPPKPEELEACISAVRSFEAPRDGNLFGPIVPVPESAPALDRLLGLTGRDPGWQPAV
jgi:uncharacterized protein (TIGR03086 family)